MVTVMVVLGVLLVLFLFGIMVNATTRLAFLEKEAEVIGFIDVHDDSESRDVISGYKPVVRFEVDGKAYQGTADVFPLWKHKDNKSLVILYDPQNPSEFKVKESSTSPATGCIFAIIVIVAFAITMYFYLRKK